MANGAEELLGAMKLVVENYVNNKSFSDLLVGIYNGEAIVVNEKLPIPVELVQNRLLLFQLCLGDKVKLLRKQGGKEYYIIEILDKNTKGA